ncbi:hypothetical protein UA08_04298 [Talaromyces atroroseus]|uniref:Mediator of RNA polymerase II transcription subunit 9 n=1 Tax=Talaromyces atroroseus TaxID=1441469 RepID=A0A1Q5Q9J6_TALAT|nr:hypothetical protein UA08_04298 [Talaromyces atroroseus]OKL60785.1 hypothetical protein UA08_04298 [Talaromyces atroroseus]
MTSKSPVSAVSQQRKVSSTPDAANQTSPQSAAVAFPSPQAFDFIPPLHALLLRLQASASTATANQPSSAVDAGSQSQQKQSQQQPPSQLKSSTSSSTAPSTQTIAAPPALPSASTGDSSFAVSNANPNALPPLEAKDLSTAASAIKIRIQKARAVIENLPDVDRTIDEQAEEMDELQERIACLKAVITDFGRRAAVKEDDKMDQSV